VDKYKLLVMHDHELHDIVVEIHMPAADLCM